MYIFHSKFTNTLRFYNTCSVECFYDIGTLFYVNKCSVKRDTCIRKDVNVRLHVCGECQKMS